VALCWSDDQGVTWSKPWVPFSSAQVEGNLGLFRSMQMTSLGQDRVVAALCWVVHTDPSLPFFNTQTEGLLDTKIFLTESNNAGETWSEPRLVEDFPHFHLPTPITGPPLILSDGTMAIQYEVNKPYYETSPWEHSSVLIYSSDGGMTWDRTDVVSHDPANKIFYWDQRPSLMQDGRILDLFWTYDNVAATYLPIHSRIQNVPLGNWGPLVQTTVPGQPAPAVDFGEGTVAMVYMDRSGVPELKLRISNDDGVTWPSAGEVVLYRHDSTGSQTWNKGSMDDAWAEMGKFSVGLPDTAKTPEGSLLVVYYAGRDTDYTGIHWINIPKEKFDSMDFV